MHCSDVRRRTGGAAAKFWIPCRHGLLGLIHHGSANDLQATCKTHAPERRRWVG
jgi:hypothetical protein